MKDIHLFVNEWSGRYNNEDGAYGPQCVDLVKQWEKENGWTPLTHGNAIDYWNNGESGYRKVVNTPTAVPPVGALIVFQVGQYGHIGIVVSANQRAVTVFEQNDPLGSPCQLKTYNYVSPRCLGWLIHN